MIDKINHVKKYGYDVQRYLIALLNKAQSNPEDIPDTISRDTYYKVKDNPDSYEDWFVGLVGFCASYNSKWFGGYANGVKTKIGTIRNYTDEAIKNLKAQSKDLVGTVFKCKDFRDIDINRINNYVVYCDIPYRNTTKYGKQNFPYEEFYEWCKKLSKNNVVLISEYSMPNGFKCIWEKSLNCTLNHNEVNRKIERLFIVE